GTHFTGSGVVDSARHPLTYKRTQLLKKLFAGKEDVLKQFRNDTLMPIETSYDRLSAAEFERILSWVDAGLPKLDQLLVEEARPTNCVDDFAGLKDHVRSV